MGDPADKPSFAEGSTTLPQYGFGSEFTFKTLVDHNPFIFRVYTPKARSPFYDGTEPFFVGHAFNEPYTTDSQPLPDIQKDIASTATYRDVETHMDWTTRSSSPFISTSFSFAWSIWEALRRYQMNMKHNIEVAIIDARAVAGHAVTALELLRQSKSKERHRDFWKWYRFALESQDVLVHGYIPGTAVLASLPLLSLLDKLPSYFIDPQDIENLSVLDKVGWHSLAQRSPSYRQFCQSVSERFLQMPAELRLRDTTAQSVRLAVTLLRPWFHKTVHHDVALATSRLSELAFVISQWPGQWWARDHAELWEIIRHTVLLLGEEIREQHKLRVAEEVQRLQDAVRHLDGKVEELQLLESQRIGVEEEPTRVALADSTSDTASNAETLTAETLTAVTSSPEGVTVKDLPPELTEAVEDKGVDPWLVDIPEILPSSEPVDKPISILETMVTGFLFGAFVTLCLLSTQRRTLANHLT